MFNLGTGIGYSVAQVLDVIQTVVRRAPPKIVGPRQPGDPPQLVSDPSLAKQVLDFKACRSDLRTIVETAWAWHIKAHPYQNDPR